MPAGRPSERLQALLNTSIGVLIGSLLVYFIRGNITLLGIALSFIISYPIALHMGCKSNENNG